MRWPLTPLVRGDHPGHRLALSVWKDLEDHFSFEDPISWQKIDTGLEIKWSCASSAPRKIALAADLSTRFRDAVAPYYEPGKREPVKTAED